MITALINKLFGRRYRKGWPRGARPMFPWVEEMRVADPEWWRDWRHESPIIAVREFFRRHPDHPLSADPYFAEVLPKRAA